MEQHGDVNASEVVAAISDAENRQDWDALAGLFDEDVTITHPGLGPVTGRDANLSVMQFIIGAISGYQRTTDDLVVDGSRGAFRFTISGTHTGDLPGYPATNEPVDISGEMFFRLDGDRLVEAVELLTHDSTRNVSLR